MFSVSPFQWGPGPRVSRWTKRPTASMSPSRPIRSRAVPPSCRSTGQRTSSPPPILCSFPLRAQALRSTRMTGSSTSRSRHCRMGTYGLAVDTRANRLYATNRDENTVSVIDISAPDPGAFKKIARLPIGRTPEGVAFDAASGVAYVGNSGENTVSLIDGGKFDVFATIVVGPSPKAVVVDPVTGRVYVPSQTDDLVRVIQP